MKLIVNGEDRDVPAATLEEAVAALGYKGDCFAVALNRACVPRGRHAATAVKDGDEVEILAPMQGG